MVATRRISIALLLTLAAPWAGAQEPQISRGTVAEAPKSDEQAQQVLEQAKQRLQQASRIAYKAKLHLQVEMGAQKQETLVDYTVSAQRPNKLALDVNSPTMGEIRFISTGEEFILFSPNDKRFRRDTAPESLARLQQDGYLPPDPRLGFVLTFVEDAPLAALLEGVTASKYVGKEAINGVDAHHLQFLHPELNWDLWVRADDQPLPLQLKPDMSQIAQQGGPQMQGMNVSMTIGFSDWAIDGDIPQERFAFTPPEGAEEVKEPVHPLVGTPAPAFTLESLDGNPFDFAQHKGKDIVLLDFWATWCVPCRVAMPLVERVVNQFKDKNVVLYAVNKGETRELIEPFLDQLGVDVPVLLDSAGAVSAQYQADKVPQLILIGKDGTIQAVHQGVGPSSERRLTSQLRDLVEGKSLVPQTTAAAGTK